MNAPAPALEGTVPRADSGPLAGRRVLEIGHMLAGPYAGLLLADLGAEVIKIEPPEGDIARSVSPHRVGPHNAYFASLNRSKKSVVLDLASDEGQRALGGLAAGADALIVNLRPSAIRKLGLTYQALRRHNERLVCVALTGYGLRGRFADQPAYDYVIQALTGVMALTGDPAAPPTKAGYSAVDNSAGIMAALGLVAKIVEGRGGQVDVAMVDVMLSQLNYLAGASLNAGELPRRHANSAHPYIVPAQLFATADGYLTLFISHDGFWRIFCDAVGRPDWAVDPASATMAARRENRERVLTAISALLLTRPTAQWVAMLAPLGIVVAPIETLDRALDGELAREREMVVELPCAEGRLRAVGAAIKCDGQRPVFGEPPLLGEHTLQLLRIDGPAAPVSDTTGPPSQPPTTTATTTAATTTTTTASTAASITVNRIATRAVTGSGRAISRRELGRRLTRLANADISQVLRDADFDSGTHAPRIGLTGPPGAGKSSLGGRLALLRARQRRIGVLAVDPSSPRSGGAILGDRVRIDELDGSDQLYVRSIASRSAGDGLAENLPELMRAMDRAGFDELLLETVGVGQAEHAARNQVDTLVLMLVPGSGDAVQAMKAGIMELADLYVVNKCDLAGAAQMVTDIQRTLHLASTPSPGDWRPPVLMTSIHDPDSIGRLSAEIDRHQAWLAERGDADARRAARARYRLRNLLERCVAQGAAALDDGMLERPVAEQLAAVFDAMRTLTKNP